MKKDIIVGIGEVLFDVLPSGRKLGGAPANFAFHSSQFGYDAYMVSAVGCDELGDEIINTLTEKGVNCMIQRSQCPTGTVQVELSGDGMPNYEIKEGVAWDNIEYTDEIDTLAQNAKCVVFGSLAQRNKTSRDTIQRFISKVSEREDTIRVFDINLRQNFYTLDIIEESLRLCNVLKINDEELEVLMELCGIEYDDVEQLCRGMMDKYSIDIFILTAGGIDSTIFHNEDVSYIVTPRVEVADTVGAGDSFTATFAASLLGGKSIPLSHENAVTLAAYVCTQHGAMPLFNDEMKSRV